MTQRLDETTGRPDAPILLVTKLHPPFVPAQVIARERLFERLRDGRDCRLSLVACPAGFGKSTLLAAWRESEARPVGWVTLDEGDNDAVVLWSHVIEALCRACPALAHETLAALAASAPVLEVVLPRLINALAEQPALALVLDDFHRLSNATTRQSVTWFVDHLPASVQLVLATRTDPTLPLGTLRARGQLLELRADELRFTAAEADEFLNARLGLELARADVDLLVARTEGWPAGIYLAALSLAGTDDKPGLVKAFDGTSAHVVDFLASEVLAAHEPELQAFMLRTSVLERLLRAAVRRGARAARVGRTRWSRWAARTCSCSRSTTAAAGFASTTSSRRSCAWNWSGANRRACPSLHRRAFEWHREFGTTDEAIHHAVAAQAFPEAGQLIAETWVHYANAGRTASVSEWLPRIPEAVLDADPQLLLAKAWISALRGREDEMRAAVATVRALGGLDAGPLPDGFASLESSLSVLYATFGWGDVSAILEHGNRSAELEGPDSPWRPVITWALGWAHYCNDDLDEAERWLKETTEIAPLSEQWIVGVAAIADLSLIAGMRGRRAEQMRLALEAVDLTRKVGLLDAIEDGEVHTAHGVALAAHGRLQEALPALEKGVFLRRLWAQKLDLIDGLIALAPTVAAPRRPDPRGGAVRGGGGDRGELPRRGRAPRAARGGETGRADQPRGGGRGAQRARADGPAPAGRRALRARDRPGALPLVQHGPQPREGRLPQARGLLARGSARPRERPGPALIT